MQFKVKVQYDSTHMGEWQKYAHGSLTFMQVEWPFHQMNADIRNFGEAGFGLYSEFQFHRRVFSDKGLYNKIKYAILDSLAKNNDAQAGEHTAFIGNPLDFTVSFAWGGVQIDGVNAGTALKKWDSLEPQVKKFCGICESVINSGYDACNNSYNYTITLFPRKLRIYQKQIAVGEAYKTVGVKIYSNTKFTVSEPTINFSQVGGYKEIIKKLEDVVEILHDPKGAEAYNIQPMRGIVLHGAPGVGKSFMAKAVAGEAKLPYIEVSLSEILSKWYGESERSVAELYRTAVEVAKSRSGCIIVLNEADAFFPDREFTDKYTRLITSTFLQEIEKVSGYNTVTIATTNFKQLVDKAMLRPGRFAEIIEVPLPDYDARLEILRLKLEKLSQDKREDSINLAEIANLTDGKTGADLEWVVSNACMAAFRKKAKVTQELLRGAIDKKEKKEDNLNLFS